MYERVSSRSIVSIDRSIDGRLDASDGNGTRVGREGRRQGWWVVPRPDRGFILYFMAANPPQWDATSWVYLSAIR